MSYVPKQPAPDTQYPVLSLLVPSRESLTLSHLVTKSGRVLCRCSLDPYEVVLVESVLITPHLAQYLCGECQEKYGQMTDAGSK